VVVDVDPSAPEGVHADGWMLREVLENLVSNAVAVAPEGTAVTLSVTGEDGSVRFAVHDRGPGFTEADLAVLFGRYALTERSRASRGHGLGLGLSIVRRLVEAHGGTYGATSDAGGTTVWVTFAAA
jgi:two-component system sensor histidine kinase BaeS